jgi:hypothetical protein
MKLRDIRHARERHIELAMAKDGVTQIETYLWRAAEGTDWRRA